MSRAIDILLTYLKEEKANVVFGVPGGLLHPFFAAVEDDPAMTLIVTRHEEGAAFMADGYARLGHRLAVCAGTSGPGSTNLLTGVAVAFADGVPMLVLTGQAASYAMGKGAAQEMSREDLDIVAMFRPITKYSAMVTSPAQMGHHLRRALRLALSGRPGPVHLNIPVDIWEKPLEEEWFNPKTYRPSTPGFDRNMVQLAAQVLVEAKYPVILAGSGIESSQSEEHLLTLAELLPTRVCTSPRAKGVLPEDHPLSLGILGFAGHSIARDVVLGDQVDVLLTIGASLNETTTLNWHHKLRPSKALIQLDIDADRIGRNYPVDIPLIGDAQTILVELIYHIHRLIRDGHILQSKWFYGEPPLFNENAMLHSELRYSENTPISPQCWRRELEEVLPDDAVIFSDVGGHMLFNIHYLRMRRKQRFILNMGFGSMGHGTAAPIGAALAKPSCPIFAIVGDACFTMNGMEILTAAEYDIPVIWIVENNNMHGIIWHGTKMLPGGKPMQSIRFKKRLEVAAIARAMGLPAWVVDAPNQLPPIVQKAISMRTPAVIEIRVDGSIPPPLGDRAKAIAGFIK